MSLVVRLSAGAPLFWMKVRPSIPTGTSMICFAPFLTQLSYSLFLIEREASVKSGVSAPTPAQNSFIPAPVPVDSTITLVPGLSR